MSGNKFVQRLIESFDSGVSVEWDTNSYVWTGSFELGGTEYEVFFIKKTKNNWVLTYANTDKTSQQRNYVPTGNVGVSAIKILSTVVQCVVHFIGKMHPDEIEFDGDKSVGLSDLYSKMADKLGQKLKSLGYKISKDVGPSSPLSQFKISKIIT